MSYRRRTFPEVLDRLLVATIGGIAAEEHPFPPPGNPPYLHGLTYAPAVQLISLFGMQNGQSHLFQLDKDYSLTSDKQSITWLDGGDSPDPGSLISVNYLHSDTQATLNDLHVGSITRTLSESIGLEISRLYSQLQFVYEAGFINTAQGSSLENLVSLLGIERIKGGFPSGELELLRATSSGGSINIPSGTRVLDETGNVEYETTANVTLAPHQDRIRVTIRDLERNDPVAADTLTVLAIPIAGIASVSNPAATAINMDQENDSQLRSRAKHFLHGNERGTLGAIKQAIARQQINADVVETGVPGYIEYTLHGDSITPELEQRVKTAIEEARPAGVVVTAKAHLPPEKINVSLQLHTNQDALEIDINLAHQQVKSAIEIYLKDLPVADDGRVNQLVGQILSFPLVEDVSITHIALETHPDISILDSNNGTLALASFPTVLGQLSITDPNLPTQLAVVIQFQAENDIPDETKIRQAINTMLSYLNTINSQPLTQANIAELSFGKLLLVVPLPNHSGASLEDFDKSNDAPTLAAEVAPYQLAFTFAQNSGLTQFVQSDGVSYTLAPNEQLSLSTLALQVED